MRKILFRGKTWQGNWVYGVPIHAEDEDGNEAVFINEYASTGKKIEGKGRRIRFFMHTEVVPETLGQNTGFKDRNGKEIFEWDILKYTAKVNSGMNAGTVHEEYCKVVWCKSLGAWCVEPIGDYHLNITCTRYLWERHGYHAYETPPDVEFYADIIGNIHDNPDFLK